MLVHGLHHVKAALRVQRIRYCRAEGILLCGGGHDRRRAEHGVYKLLMHLRRLAGVVERVIDVRRARVKAREHEAQRGVRDGLPRRAEAELAALRAVAQLRLGGAHRAYAAHEVFEYLAAVLLHRAVAPVVGDVVGVRREENEVAALILKGESVDYPAVERLARLVVVQKLLFQPHEYGVLLAPGDLRRGELNVDEVLPQRPRERLFHYRKVHFRLVMAQKPE